MSRRSTSTLEEDYEDLMIPRKRTRATKTTRVVKDKFAEEAKSKVIPLSPLNDKQAEYIRLIKEKPLVLATGFAGSSKCAKFDTLIPTPEGIFEIQDFLDCADGYHPLVKTIYGINGEEQTSHLFKESNSHILKLKTLQGFEIEATDEHPVLVFNGITFDFKKLEDMEIGDVVCINRKPTFDTNDKDIVGFSFQNKPNSTTTDLDITIPKSITPELGSWFGYLIANGSLSQTATHFSNNDRLKSDDFIKLSNNLFDKLPSKYDDSDVIHSVVIRDFINYIVGGWKTARYKSVPKLILQSSLETRRRFLRSLFDCDSSFNGNVFKYSTASEQLAKQVQVMLLDFGIIGRRKPILVKKYPDHVYWDIWITSNDLDGLFDKILFDTLKYTDIKMSDVRNTNIDVIPGLHHNITEYLNSVVKTLGVAGNGWYDSPSLKKKTTFKLKKSHMGESNKEYTYKKLTALVDSWQGGEIEVEQKEAVKDLEFYCKEILDKNFFFDKVESVEDAGFTTVYDFTVPGTHSFVSNGFVSHNTYIPTVMACDALLLGKDRGGIDKIVLSRPNISNSKSLGYMKGSLLEKYSYWLAPVLSIMRERLGDERLNLHLEKGNIEFVPMEVIKGYSAADCFFIVDEAEDITWEEAIKVVTRQGRNCTMVLAGDVAQSELKTNSGLLKLIELAKKNPQLDVGLVDFNEFSDIVRSKAAREWIKVLVKENELK